MPGDDGDWDSFDADDRTIDESRQAVPEATPPARGPDTTGRHRTLQGYVDQEIAVARARLDERRFLLKAFALWQMERGTHPEMAHQLAARFEIWMGEGDNARLVRVALGDA